MDPRDSSDPWARFEESRFVPSHGILRMMALAVYVAVFNTIGLVFILAILFSDGMDGGSPFFWPKRWW